jgi:hypothetical protein
VGNAREWAMLVAAPICSHGIESIAISPNKGLRKESRTFDRPPIGTERRQKKENNSSAGKPKTES